MTWGLMLWVRAHARARPDSAQDQCTDSDIPCLPVHCAVRMAFQLDRPHQECQNETRPHAARPAAVFVGTSAWPPRLTSIRPITAGSASAPAAKAMPGKVSVPKWLRWTPR